MYENVGDDKWIMDLSTNEHLRNKRWERLKPYIESGEPVYFIDYKRPYKHPYLAVFTWEDVKDVSSDPETFFSEDGYTINDLFKGIPFNGSLLGMDGDKHRGARSLVSSAFGRSSLASHQSMIDSIVKTSIENFLKNNPSGNADIYDDLCMKIPLEVNSELMGIPKEDRALVNELTKFVVGNDDPKYGDCDPMVWMRACRRLKRYALNLAERMKNSTEENITSMLLSGIGDDKPLTIDEYAQFFILMAVAGMETTSHTLAHGIKLLETNHDQKELLLSDVDRYVESASEEILRMEPPSIHFRRTTTKEVTYRNLELRKRQKIVMWFNCANRDFRKFDDPFTFRIDRPNRPSHHSFGAPGIHRCLGAQLARMELHSFYKMFYEYFPSLSFDPEKILYSRSRWSNGIIEFPVSWKP